MNREERVKWLNQKKTEFHKRSRPAPLPPKAEDIICYDLTHFPFMVELESIAEEPKEATRSDDVAVAEVDGQMPVEEDPGARASSMLVQRMQVALPFTFHFPSAPSLCQ